MTDGACRTNEECRSGISLPEFTERLLLREFADADVPLFATYRSDPDVARYQSWEAPFTEPQARRMLDEMASHSARGIHGWRQVAIALREGGELIGDCAYCVAPPANPDDRIAEIGFTIARSHQRRGYALEAVQRLIERLRSDLGIAGIRAITDARNTASIGLLERLGMRRFAVRHNVWFKGAAATEYDYGIVLMGTHGAPPA